MHRLGCTRCLHLRCTGYRMLPTARGSVCTAEMLVLSADALMDQQSEPLLPGLEYLEDRYALVPN